MGVIQDILEGVGMIVVGVGKVVFNFLKCMLLGAVCIIYGIYCAAKGIFSFAKKVYKKLKKERPGAKITRGGSATLNVMKHTLHQMKVEVANGTLRLSDSEKEDVLKDVSDIEKKIASGEANGMHWTEGTNEAGEDEIFDAELVRYEEMDEDAKRRDNSGAIFVQNFS